MYLKTGKQWQNEKSSHFRLANQKHTYYYVTHLIKRTDRVDMLKYKKEFIRMKYERFFLTEVMMVGKNRELRDDTDKRFAIFLFQQNAELDLELFSSPRLISLSW